MGLLAKPLNRVLFLACVLVTGALAGAFVWAFFFCMDIGIEFAWHTLPEVLGAAVSGALPGMQPGRFGVLAWPLVMCVGGGLVIGLYEKHVGFAPEELNSVMARVKSEGRYPYDHMGKRSIAALLPLLFGGSVLFTSAIEYLTGWVLEKVFHDKWWDYSKRPLNIKGYVCLEFSVLWGIACVFVVDVFQPLVAKVVDLIPKKLGWVLLGTFSALWIADNIITAMEIRKLPKKLHALQAIEDSLTAISDEIGEEIYIRASDAKDRGMEIYTDAKEKGAQIAEKGAQIAEKRAENSLMRRSELLARRSELLQRREELLGQRNIVHERIAQAFPALREGKTNGPAFTRVHEHAQRRKQLAKALKAKARELKNKAKDRS